MKTPSIIFIASQEYENLGIGYMASFLKRDGFDVRSLNFNRSKYRLSAEIKKCDPIIVGFSVIFQYYLDVFIDLICYLRREGINCHFTAGGHYASLKPGELFNYIPQLDSIVRFEGEHTMLELAVCINRKSDWKHIEGISRQENGKTINNKLRPLERDIDNFPFPYRRNLRKFAFGIPAATIIAGRGCVYNCSFCNAGKFYTLPGGPVKRIRNPEKVIDEMEQLFYNRNCPVFLFVDDDFPLSRSNGKWIDNFCHEMDRRKLSETILLKICCRPDEVSEEIIIQLKKHGLFLIFLGIEDGTEAGLMKLNKKITVDKIINGLAILKKAGIGIDFGFLLFQPWTTFTSLNENLDFLQKICGDGYMPVSYLKVMPYYETRLEKELIKQGRLKKTLGIRDYDFTDVKMNNFYDFVSDSFSDWLNSNYGLHNICSWMRNYLLVYKAFFGENEAYAGIEKYFRGIVSRSNNFLISTHRELSLYFESGLNSPEYLSEVKNRISRQHWLYVLKIKKQINSIYLIAISDTVRNLGIRLPF